MPNNLVILLPAQIGINLDLAMQEIPSLEQNMALSVRTFHVPQAMQKSQVYLRLSKT
jgi:hypothetical protein